MNKIDIRMKSVFIDTDLFIQVLDSSRVRPQQVAREIRKKVGYGNHGNVVIVYLDLVHCKTFPLDITCSCLW